MPEDEINGGGLVSVKDLLGISKPLMKLVDVVAKGTGVLYKPTSIRKEAKAKADEIRYIAQADAEKITIVTKAEADSKKMLAIADAEIEERIRARLTSQEFQRQNTIENITEQAEQYLSEKVSDEPVEDDWTKRFFNISQDISNEKLQDVWARILAGEVNKPGTYSLRALEALKNMTQKEAGIFQQACTLVFESGHIFKVNENRLDDYGITYTDILTLRACEIIHDGDNLTVSVSTPKKGDVFAFKNNGVNITFSHQDKEKTMHTFDCFTFTPVGNQLKHLISEEPNQNYLEKLKEHLEGKQYSINIDAT